jgi:hypothetical protein
MVIFLICIGNFAALVIILFVLSVLIYCVLFVQIKILFFLLVEGWPMVFLPKYFFAD